jgi:hypothetical protein
MITITSLGGDDGHGDPGDCGNGCRRTSIGGTLPTAKHSITVRCSFCIDAVCLEHNFTAAIRRPLVAQL